MSASLRSPAYPCSSTSAPNSTTVSAPTSTSDHVVPSLGTGPTTPTSADFVVETPAPSPATAVNVIVNVSGSIHWAELPTDIQDLPTYTIRLAGHRPPHANAIESRATLDHFRSTCYDVFAAIEHHHKQTRDIHLIADMPLSAAVTVGQAINPQVLERVTVYHRTDGHYVPSLEIN